MLRKQRILNLRSSPVRERMKESCAARIFTRDSRFCSSSSSSRCHTAKKLVNRAQNFLNILEHLIVPETKHPVALRIEKRSADFIFAGSLDMLCAVKLDDDLAFGRAKVGEVTPNRELSSKLAPRIWRALRCARAIVQRRFVPYATSVRSAWVIRSEASGWMLAIATMRNNIRKEQNRESRARDARCNRTRTFILSLTGRGDRNRTLTARGADSLSRGEETERIC